MEISAKAAELKAQGLDVISLAAGEPDFNTPEPIQRAATKAMQDGITKYTPVPGFMALTRSCRRNGQTRENRFNVAPDEVLITCGAKHALYLALQCLVEARRRRSCPYAGVGELHTDGRISRSPNHSPAAF